MKDERVINEIERPFFHWLGAASVTKLTKAIEAAGGTMRFVGGIVRDSLLGRPPSVPGNADMDVATDLAPDQTLSALKAAGLKSIPTGLDHGTVTAIIDDQKFEITSLRADIETDGRHAKVAFTKDWQQDWRRRDFTIGAIYLSSDGTLWDPAKGMGDLAAARVRFIGNPATRLAEDYLRILRFYRLSAHFAQALDQEAREACRQAAPHLAQIAGERKQAELIKLFAAPRTPLILKAMAEDKILPHLVPAPPNLEAVAQLYGIGEPDFETIVVTLWSDDPKQISKNLRLSRRQFSTMVQTLKAAKAIDKFDEKTARQLLYRVGPEIFVRAVQWRAAFAPDSAAAINIARWTDLPHKWQAPVFPVNGLMLQEKGVKPGPALGRCLKKIEQDWIDKGYPTDRETITAIIKDHID